MVMTVPEGGGDDDLDRRLQEIEERRRQRREELLSQSRTQQAEPEDPLRAIAERRQQRRQDLLQHARMSESRTVATFRTASELDAERAAEARDLAVDLGISFVTSYHNLEALRQGISERSLAAALRSHPVTRRFMSEPDVAAMSQDSWQNLVDVETRLTAARETGVFAGAGNVIRGVGARGVNLAGGALDAVSIAAEPLEDAIPVDSGQLVPVAEADRLEQESPLSFRLDFGGYSYVMGPNIKAFGPGGYYTEIARDLSNVTLGYEPGTTWEQVKKTPLSAFLPWALETGVISLPDMGAALINLPAYIVARSGEMARERGVNQGRYDPTVNDLVATAPAAVASSLLERLGARGVFGLADDVGSLSDLPRAAGVAALTEALTEAGQEGLESAATTIGTERGFNLNQTLEAMLAGGLAGGVFGGTVRGVTGPAELLTQRSRAEAAVNILTELHEAVQAAPLTQRSARTVQEFIDQADPDGEIRIDSDAQELFQGEGGGLLQHLERFGITREQAELARQRGEDIVITKGALMTLEGEAFNQVVRHVRTEPEAATLAEVENAQLEETLRIEFAEALANLQEKETQERFASLVGVEVARQARAAGRSTQEAEQVGAVWTAMFNTLVERHSLTQERAQEVFQQLGLRIQSGEPGQQGASPEKFFQFVGQNALTADSDALAEAQRRIEAGEDSETIRQETGWFQGADGGWRFEITDADARLTVDQVPDNAKVPMERLLEHDRLYEAYPRLRQLQVHIINGDNEGGFNSGTGYLMVSARTIEDARSILLHEIQHAIQSVEGFARGGTPRSMLDEINLAIQSVRSDPAYVKLLGSEVTRRLDNFIKVSLSGYEDAYFMARNMLRQPLIDRSTRDDFNNKIAEISVEQYSMSRGEGLALAERIIANINRSPAFTNYRFEIDQILKRYYSGPLDPFDAYQYLAGEVEARDVQARADLSQMSQVSQRPGSVGGDTNMVTPVPVDVQLVRPQARRDSDLANRGRPTSDPFGQGGQNDGQRGRGSLAGSAAGGEVSASVSPSSQPLEGAPRVAGEVFGPIPDVVSVAERYATENGIELKRQAEFVEVDEAFAARVADAYEAMEHAPGSPAVQEAYANLIEQTTAQYQALVDAGYEFFFVDVNSQEGQAYLASPWNAMRDLRDNKRMGIFPTDAGYGTGEFDVTDNPMLAETGMEWEIGDSGQTMTVYANDLFRAVHDAFGHGMEGAGFRARGEENAWQAHVRLFTGSAVGAITSETRGQNSWLNYGPYGETNRTAQIEDTIFADQKTGLMPEWTWTEGRAPDLLQIDSLTLNDDGVAIAGPSVRWDIENGERANPAPVAYTTAPNGERILMDGYHRVVRAKIEGRGEIAAIETPWSDQMAARMEREFGRGFDAPRELFQGVQPDGDHPNRISTRFPQQKRSTEDPLTERLQINAEAMKATPAAWQHNAGVIKAYPNMRTRARNADRVMDDFKAHVVGNLLWLHDQVPAEIRDQSKRWYDGARRITDDWSQRYGLPDHSVAGVLAALSPQKDWYQNVSLAERVLDITAFKAGEPWSPQMEETAQRIFASEKYAGLMAEVRGKRLEEITEIDAQSAWVRIYDEAHHDRRYREVSADGDFLGEPSGKTAWGSLVEVGKAVSVIRDPSYEAVSRQMGSKHKVRSFFNNILAPKAPHGDVTIDTHAVAAGLLRPLSGASAEVHHNFGSSPEKKKQPDGWVAAKKSGVAGAEGTYGIYADAYREAAAERGLLAREMQSITWEAVRGLFPAKWKQKKNIAAANEIWQNYKSGDITAEQAQEQINDLAGGIAEPSWYGPGAGRDVAPERASYARDVSGAGVSRQSAIGVDSGAGERAAGAVSDQADRELNQSGSNIGVDNPGGDWLAGKIERARTGPPASGPITAYTKSPVMFPVAELQQIPGAMGEQRQPGEAQFDNLSEAVKREGFRNDSPILVGVSYDGQAYIIEGNTRVAVAAQQGIEAIPAEVRWFVGGEQQATDVTPERVAALPVAERDPRILNQGEARASVIIPGGGVLTDREVLVRLGKAANKTSLLHESAHIFLEIYAALEGENESIAAEMAAIREWLGAEPGARLNRDQHEKFAESWEVYLMEGKAPAEGLRGAFRKFRRWFTEVYRKIRGQLQLDEEARDLFDRMLATDDQIEQVRSGRALTLSKTMADLMSEEDRERYMDQALKAGDEARERIFRLHVEEIEKRNSREYRRAATELRKRARETVMAQPVYRAWDAFVNGEGPRLSRQDIIAIAGEAAPAAIPRGKRAVYVEEGGLDPDMIASDYGFESGEALVNALLEMSKPKDAVQAETQRLLDERFGDIQSDGTVEAEALAAAFNEPSVRMLQAEVQMLAEKANQRPIPQQAIKAEAKRIVSTDTVREGKKAASAAQRSQSLHRKARQAAAKGEFVDALRYAHQAMLQHEIARQRWQVRDETAKFERLAARYSPRRKIDTKRFHPTYVEPIRLLVSYLQDQVSHLEKARRLNEFVKSEADQGRTLLLPGFVAEGREMPVYSEISVADMRQWRDAVKSFAHNARKLAEMERGERAELHRALAAGINESWGDRRRITYTRAETIGENLQRLSREFDSAILALPFIAETLQGGKRGLVADTFYNDLADAQTRRERRQRQLEDGLTAILDRHGITQNEMNRKVSEPVIQAGREVTMQQVFAVLLNTGSASNFQRLVDDKTINGDAQAIMEMLERRLEKRHFDAAQEIWDLINTQREDLGATWRRRTGATPQWVEAMPLETRYGTYRGGYYPLAYDPAADKNRDIKKKNDDNVFQDFGASNAAKAQTASGMVQERLNKVNRPLWLDLNVLLKHFEDTASLIEMSETVDRAWAAISSQPVKEAIEQTRGGEYITAIENILKRTASGKINPDAGEVGFLNRILRGARVNASVAILGANIQTAMLAPVSYFQTIIPRYGIKTVTRGVLEYYGRGPAETVRRDKLMMEKSEFMRERAQLINREAHERVRRSVRESTWSRIQGAGYLPMVYIEKYTVSGPLWWGVYTESLEQGLTEAQAIQEADKAVNTTQGSGRMIDQAQIQSSASELLRVLTFMWGYVSRYYGVVRNDVADADGLKKLAPIIKHMVIANAAASMVEALIRYNWDDDDEDEGYFKTVLELYRRNILGMIPGSQFITSRFDTGPALSQTATKGVYAFEAWADTGVDFYESGQVDGELARAAAARTAQAVGFAVGAPGVVQADKTFTALFADDDPTLQEIIVTGPDDDR